MKFNGLTEKGREYLAKIQAKGIPIQFAKIKFGNGKLEENENPAKLLDIKSIKTEKSILEKEQNNDAVTLTTLIDNVGLEEGYFPRETGIYVLDNSVEILYFYINDGDETSWLPPEADGPHKMEIKINLLTSNAETVIVHNDGTDLYITKEYAEKNYTKNGGSSSSAKLIEDKINTVVGGILNPTYIQDYGVKKEGQFYTDKNNLRMYKCIKTTTIDFVNNTSEYFKDYSVDEIQNRLENLSKYPQLESTPRALKADIVVFNKIVFITVRSSAPLDINYGITYKINIPSTLNVVDASSSITGNNGSSGQLFVENNVISINSTSRVTPLTSTVMGQIVTFLK